jgi:hypothetical protein
MKHVRFSDATRHAPAIAPEYPEFSQATGRRARDVVRETARLAIRRRRDDLDGLLGGRATSGCIIGAPHGLAANHGCGMRQAATQSAPERGVSRFIVPARRSVRRP